MELYAKGQLSYLILNCLLERDFYGLDIITEINSKSGGKVNLKKPSVYSNLTRMEKQGYVSSYSKSSDVGPNRKYYSITDAGRDFYNEIDKYYSRNNIDVFSEFVEETTIEQQKSFFTNDFEEKNEVVSQDEPETDESEDTEFFDFSGVEEVQEDSSISETQNEDTIEEPENITEPQIEEKTNVLDERSTLAEESKETKTEDYVFSIKKALLAEKTENETKNDDGKFLNSQEVSTYNQHVYDVSKDINSYKKKKSFAEDQISFSAEAPLLSSANERKKSNLEEFKNSILQNKESYGKNQDSFTRFSNYRDRLEAVQTEKVQPEEVKQEEKDDGKFIFTHVDAETIEKPRKIEPPRLKILPENGKEKLPAPKRDSSIDPSHQEILSQLYAKTKGSSSAEQREDCLYDYSDLKDFYKNQNISFDVYEKPSAKMVHNTNKLYFITSLITFLCAGVFSLITFVVLSKTLMLNKTFNFLYILLPVLLLVDVGIKAYNMIKFKSWLPKQILPHWKIWTITLALIAVCVGLNFAFGMAVNVFSLFATTLLLPTILILVVIPLRYYVNRYLLIHKWH